MFLRRRLIAGYEGEKKNSEILRNVYWLQSKFSGLEFDTLVENDPITEQRLPLELFLTINFVLRSINTVLFMLKWSYLMSERSSSTDLFWSWYPKKSFCFDPLFPK